MSTEPGQLFTGMRDDLGDVLLVEPGELRRVGTRRRRRNRVAALAGVALLVGGIAIGAAWAVNRPTALNRPEIGTSTVPSPSPPADPSGEPADRCTDDGPVPYRVFLQPGEGAMPEKGCAAPDRPHLPSPCTTAPAGLDDGVDVRRTITMYVERVPAPKEPTTPADYAAETVMRYRDAAAAAHHLDVLSRAVQACPTVTRDGVLWRHDLVRTGFAGDESMLVSASYTGDLGGATFTKTELAAVVRIGRVVVVYFAHGWESGNADRDLTVSLAKKAAARTLTWQ